MKFKGTLIGEASGSVSSLTASHNRGGQYFRQRAVPVNPNTSFQQEVRNQMADLTSRWTDVLTPAQRAGWDQYALQVKLPDALGEPRNVGGLAMYCRSNISRIQSGLARVNAAPGVYNLGSFTEPGVGTWDIGLGQVEITFTNTDDWASEVGSAMLLYASRPQNPSINYFKGPYRYAGRINGAATPPVSPFDLTLPFPVAAGQTVFFQVRVTRADGRLSGVARFRGDVA